MQRIMMIGPVRTIAWSETPGELGPVLPAFSDHIVEFNEEIMTNLLGTTYYVVAFNYKGQMQRFEVRSDFVGFRAIGE